ncbi:hypothetical protein VTI74DRAFT_8830 [Chaetomium olivicolor]
MPWRVEIQQREGVSQQADTGQWIEKGNAPAKEQVTASNKGKNPPSPSAGLRKREHLVPAEVQKLMDNTSEMASSARSSAVSETIKANISSFYFLLPSRSEIERLLTYHCQNGSSFAVRLILAKVVFPSSPLRGRQFLAPLIRAIKGGSARHNKKYDRALSRLFLGSNITEALPAHKRGALIMLLKSGARPNLQIPGSGDTPLHLAVRRQDRVAVTMLLHTGANVNARTYSGTKPLQVTAGQLRHGEAVLDADHAEVLEHLLQAGADVDQPAGALTRTALHWAVIAGCAEAVARLLEAGAGVGVKDNDGVDALGLAVRNVGKLLGRDVPGKHREATVKAHGEMMTSLVFLLVTITPASSFEMCSMTWRLSDLVRGSPADALHIFASSGAGPDQVPDVAPNRQKAMSVHLTI